MWSCLKLSLICFVLFARIYFGTSYSGVEFPCLAEELPNHLANELLERSYISINKQCGHGDQVLPLIWMWHSCGQLNVTLLWAEETPYIHLSIQSSVDQNMHFCINRKYWLCNLLPYNPCIVHTILYSEKNRLLVLHRDNEFLLLATGDPHPTSATTALGSCLEEGDAHPFPQVWLQAHQWVFSSLHWLVCQHRLEGLGVGLMAQHKD